MLAWNVAKNLANADNSFGPVLALKVSESSHCRLLKFIRFYNLVRYAVDGYYSRSKENSAMTCTAY